MKNFDLYKVIILLSVVLIPVAGYFAWAETQRLDYAKKALARATKTNGDLEKIGLYQKELEDIKKVGGAGELGHLIYFERRITKSAKGGSLENNEMIIGNERPSPAPKKTRAVDYEVDIEFKRGGKALALPRKFVHAMLLNCEQFSKTWRLRQLSLSHEEHAKATGKKPPPKTVTDNWLVRDLKFARREPKQKGSKKKS